MDCKKYKFVEDDFKVCPVDNKIVHRIIALRNFSNIKTGDLGGYVESEYNLSHDGKAWVYNDAIVSGNARVTDNATVRENAIVAGNAFVTNEGSAMGGCLIYGNASIFGYSVIMGDAIISDNVVCDEYTVVNGNAVLMGSLILEGKSKINGCFALTIPTNVRLYDANIESISQIITITGIGSRFDTTAVYRNIYGGLSVSCGCFHGSIKEFKEEVKETHGRSIYAKEYMSLIKLAMKHDFGADTL